MEKSLCIKCGDFVSYRVKESESKETIKGEVIEYREKVAYCKNCGAELWVKEVEHDNVEAPITVYCEKHGLISPPKIRSILKKYCIGKRSLSKLLGLPGITIKRFLEGQIPSRIDSDELLEILNDKEKYLELLQKNKIAIPPVSFKRSLKAVCLDSEEKDVDDSVWERNGSSDDDREELTYTATAKTIAQWFINRAYLDVDDGGEKREKMTHFKLQKLLYYAQGSYLGMRKQLLFKDKIYAWKYGPVVVSVYKEYKDYGARIIDQPKRIKIDKDTATVLEEIYQKFEEIPALKFRNITHGESPWKDTKQGEEISVESIAEYFMNNHMT